MNIVQVSVPDCANEPCAAPAAAAAASTQQQQHQHSSSHVTMSYKGSERTEKALNRHGGNDFKAITRRETKAFSDQAAAAVRSGGSSTHTAL